MMMLKKRNFNNNPILLTRRLASELLPILLVLSTTFMAWKTLSVLTRSPQPVVVVISESMAPAFHRGDIIFLWNREPTIEVSDIPVCWFPGRPTPMVHRAIKTHFEAKDSGRNGTYRQKVLTKGDNNEVNDTLLYPVGQNFGDRGEIVGVVVGYIPFLGWATIVFDVYPWLKVVGLVALSKELDLSGRGTSCISRPARVHVILSSDGDDEA